MKEKQKVKVWYNEKCEMKKPNKTKKDIRLVDLAAIVTKGFKNTATKGDLDDLKKCFSNLEDGINRSLEGFVRDFRGDYDKSTSRVKRLEITAL